MSWLGVFSSGHNIQDEKEDSIATKGIIKIKNDMENNERCKK